MHFARDVPCCHVFLAGPAVNVIPALNVLQLEDAAVELFRGERGEAARIWHGVVP